MRVKSLFAASEFESNLFHRILAARGDCGANEKIRASMHTV